MDPTVLNALALVSEPGPGRFDVTVAAGQILQPLVDACPEGGDVLLEAGTHVGPLLIRKAVRIFGRKNALICATSLGSLTEPRWPFDPDDSTVKLCGVVNVRANGVLLSGVNVRLSESAQCSIRAVNPRSVVVIDAVRSNDVIIHNCNVDGQSVATVAIGLDGCQRLKLDGCDVYGAIACGVEARRLTAFQLFHSDVYNNAQCGLSLRGGSEATLEDAKVYDNGPGSDSGQRVDAAAAAATAATPLAGVFVERGSTLWLRSNVEVVRNAGGAFGGDGYYDDRIKAEWDGAMDASAARYLAAVTVAEADAAVHGKTEEGQSAHLPLSAGSESAAVLANQLASASGLFWYPPCELFNMDQNARPGDDLAAIVASLPYEGNLFLTPGVYKASLRLKEKWEVNIHGNGRAKLWFDADDVVYVPATSRLRLYGVTVVLASDSPEVGGGRPLGDHVAVRALGYVGFYACDVSAPERTAISIAHFSPNIVACRVHSSRIGVHSVSSKHRDMRVSDGTAPPVELFVSLRHTMVCDNHVGVEIGGGLRRQMSLTSCLISRQRSVGIRLGAPAAVVSVTSDTVFVDNQEGNYGGPGWDYQLFRRRCEASIPFLPFRYPELRVSALVTEGAPGDGEPGAFKHMVAPGSSLQAAIDACHPGDSVLLLPGVHRGPVVCCQPIRLFGRGRAVIAGGGFVVRILPVVEGGHVLLDGIAVRRHDVVGSRRASRNQPGAVLVTPGANVHFRQCDLSNEGSSAVFMQEGGGMLTCEGCRFHDAMFGIYAEHAAVVDVRRCRFELQQSIGAHLVWCKRARFFDNHFVGALAPQLASNSNHGIVLSAREEDDGDDGDDGVPPLTVACNVFTHVDRSVTWQTTIDAAIPVDVLDVLDVVDDMDLS